MNRRELLKGAAVGLAVFALPAVAKNPTGLPGDARARFAALEKKRGGRLGVAVLDTAGGHRVAWRGDERFLMCSTFKLLLVATVLARVDRGEEKLERRIVFGKDALLEYAPVTSRHVGAPGLSVAGLCAAAVTLSDNTAANLLMHAVGGPAAVTACARSLGDGITRLDRFEPELNVPDGERDTTSPVAMLGDMHKLLLGDALSAASRKRLTDWLLGCRTGDDTLRAGMPRDWRVGDKTGSGHTANNDLAIAWPPRRKPLLVTTYYDNPAVDVDARKAVLAEVGRIVAVL
jgi:beta-lactamase class A